VNHVEQHPDLENMMMPLPAGVGWIGNPDVKMMVPVPENGIIPEQAILYMPAKPKRPAEPPKLIFE